MATQSLTRFLSKPKIAASLISRRLSTFAASTTTTTTTTFSASSFAAPRYRLLLGCLRPLSSEIPSFELRSLSFRGLSTDAEPSTAAAADENPKEGEKDDAVPSTAAAADKNPKEDEKEEVLLDGCDFKHWMVMMDKPEGEPTREEIIDSYVKTLAMVVGSEEEARSRIYSVSTKCYYAFSFVGEKELSEKINGLPNVCLAVPDSYLDPKNKDYGGEPFINGKAVPYDPKYHKEWLKNNNNQSTNRGPRRNVDQPRNNVQNNQRGAWKSGNQNTQNIPRDIRGGQEFQNSSRNTNSPSN